MKKYVSLLLVFVILLFAACSPAQSPESEPTTSTTAATEPSGTDVLTDPSESTTDPSEPSEEATQPSTNPPSEPSDPTTEPSEPPTEPSEPTEPTKPNEPTTKPSEPGGNSSTDDKEKPSQPTEPNEKPTDPSEPSTGDSEETDKTEKPSQPTEPTTKPTEPSEPSEPEVKLSLNKTTLSLEVGKSDTLSYTYNGTKSLTWSSSNTSVATVSNGKVTAKAAGTAVITLSDGTKQAQCVVTVKAKPETATLTINTPKNTIVFVGETLKLEYTYNGTGKLTFASWDPSILTIDSNGKMKGVSEGVVGVEVTDGTLYKFVDIVVKGVKATSIETFDMEGPLFDGVTKYVGDYMTFRAKSRPNGTARAVNVSTSNTSIVSVSSTIVNGLDTEITLKYKAAGSATITLTSEDGCVVYKYKVNVKSEYSCYPGKEMLTPEEFADACTQVMVENGFKKNTGCTSYRVLTLRPDQLTWKIAKGNAQGYVRSWYPNGCRKCWISYEGTDENGNYIFYTRWA